MGKKRKHMPKKKLSPEELRIEMEQKLRATRIPSKKKYNRKKYKGEG